MRRLHTTCASVAHRAVFRSCTTWIEDSARPSRLWLSQVASRRSELRDSRALPQVESLWSMNHSSAFDQLSQTLPYFEVLNHAAEQGLYSLLGRVAIAKDAPLPHVVYEDIMVARTFGSMQEPPEQQFSLEPRVLRTLLCLCAQHLMLDAHYHLRCKQFYETLEQQQTLGSEAISSWVWCCAAAGDMEGAMGHLESMHRAGLKFDDTVFAMMTEPHVDVRSFVTGQFQGNGKAILLHRRLGNRLQSDFGAPGCGLHAIVSFLIATNRTNEIWKYFAKASNVGSVPAKRTLELALRHFWKGVKKRQYARGAESLVAPLVTAGLRKDAFRVMMAMRQQEALMVSDTDAAFTVSESDAAAIVQAAQRADEDEEPLLAGVVALMSVRSKDHSKKLLAMARSAKELDFSLGDPATNVDTIDPTPQVDLLHHVSGALRVLNRDRAPPRKDPEQRSANDAHRGDAPLWCIV